MATLPTLRRYYLGRRRAALRRGDEGAALAFAALQRRIAWPALPVGFPARNALLDAGYETVRDLDGADEDELLRAGLAAHEATAALTAWARYKMIPRVRNNHVQQDGTIANTWDAPLLPLAARVIDGVGDLYEMADLTTLRLQLQVTALTLDASLLVRIETSADGQNDWRQVYTFAPATLAGAVRVVLPHCDRFVRARWFLTGSSPSATFSVTGEAC